jgi:hypothetical protein
MVGWDNHFDRYLNGGEPGRKTHDADSNEPRGPGFEFLTWIIQGQLVWIHVSQPFHVNIDWLQQRSAQILWQSPETVET